MTDDRYLKAMGARILSEANDLKRTPKALAEELGVAFSTVDSVIKGEAGLEVAQDLMKSMSEHYPVSLTQLWIDADDTENGVLKFSSSNRDSTSRVFDRVNAGGELTPYYDYRDTAMSRGAPFKPEWIQPLRCVGDADPENPDVTYNNGHLMHQMTFFVGEVNFYWQIGEKKFCAEMNTGDSNYITPFVPHSFTSRRPDALGLIIAVTYAGQVRNALGDFGKIGPEAADGIAGDLRDPQSAFQAILRRQMAAETIGERELCARLIAAGVDAAAAEAILSGGALPDTEQTQSLAGCLNVDPSDFAIAPLGPDQEVVLRFIGDTPDRSYPEDNQPDYKLTELARTPHQPDLKGFEVTVVDGARDDSAEIRHGLHEYVYNYGDAPVILHWNDSCETELLPGDSAYIRPMTSHRFARQAGSEEGHLVVVRVPGNLTKPVITEYAAFAPNSRARVAEETLTWF